MVAGHRGHWRKCTRALNKVHTWLRAYFAIYYCTTHKKMYTNITKQHTEMKYKLHIYMQARERAVVGSTRLVVVVVVVVVLGYSRTKTTSVLAQWAALAMGKAAWASLAAGAWVDRANESRASGSSW